MIKAGNIIKIPKGTPYTSNADYGPSRKPHKTRTEKVAAVLYVYDGGDEVGISDGPYYEKFFKTANVEIVSREDHSLDIGRRRVVGGSPIRGGGSVYHTKGTCGCGEEFLRLHTKNDVMRMHQSHVEHVARKEAEDADPVL